jgi:hypothetical protein
MAQTLHSIISCHLLEPDECILADRGFAGLHGVATVGCSR